MTPADLQLVREASQRESGHAVAWQEHRRLHMPGALPDSGRCACSDCRDDRETIAAAAPYLLAYVSEAQNVSRRVHFDLGDLD